MLVRLERAVDLGGGVARRVVELRTPTLRLQVIDAACGAFDSVGLPQSIAPRLSLFTVALGGEYRSFNAGRDARAAAGRAVFEARSEWTERWHGERQRFVVVYWEDPRGAQPNDFGSLVLGSATTQRWSQVAEAAWNAESYANQADALQLAASLVASEGVSVPAFDAAPPNTHLLQLTSALSASFTRLHEAPSWQDLSQRARLGERQLRRIWREYADYLPGNGFREALTQARVVTAKHLLSGALARPGEVARALGYGSTRAMRAAVNGS